VGDASDRFRFYGLKISSGTSSSKHLVPSRLLKNSLRTKKQENSEGGDLSPLLTSALRTAKYQGFREQSHTKAATGRRTAKWPALSR